MSIQQQSQDSIQVHIRIRAATEQPVYFEHSEGEIKLGKNCFLFDRVYDPEIDQGEVFRYTGLKSINHAMEGYNSCIFVYGQTGSGKTYTMVGGDGGIIQRAMENLFYKISQVESGDYVVGCSYYEIYNEQLYDLLDNSDKKKLNIRQDIKKGIFIEGLYEQNINTSNKGMSLINQGIRSRHVAETQMNRQSSRSHAIFTLNIQSKHIHNGTTTLKTSKLHFVDLAGSQRQKSSACLGQRLKEASNINKSLTTLGMVINSLSSQKPKSHIPFRDSKLTLVLRDSLNGNSKTYLIATISSNPNSFQQTLSTLKFAQRAKMVKLKAQINEQSLSNNVQTLKQQIRRLKQQNRSILLDLQSQKTKIKSNQISSIDEAILSNYTNNVIQINKKIDSLVELLPQSVQCIQDKQTFKVVNHNLDEIIQLRSEIINKANVSNLKLIQQLSSRKQDIISLKSNEILKTNENKSTQNLQKYITTTTTISSNQQNQTTTTISSSQEDKLINLLKQKTNIEKQPLIKQLSNEIISLKKSLNYLQNEYSLLLQNHNLLKTNYKQLEQQYSVKIQSLLQQDQRMKKQLQGINQNKNNQTLTCSVNGQQISIASLSIKMRQLQNLNQELSSQIDIMRQTVQFKDQQINSLKQNIQKLKLEDTKIELQLKSKVTEITTCKQQITYLKKMNQDSLKNNAASLSMLDKITSQHENLIHATKQIQVQLKKKIEELNEEIIIKNQLLDTEKNQNRNRSEEVRRIEQRLFEKQVTFQRSLLEKSDLEQSLKSSNKLDQENIALRQKLRLVSKQLDELKITRDFYMNSIDSLEINYQTKIKQAEQLRKINQDLSLKNNRYQSTMKQRQDDMLLLHNQLIGKKEQVIQYTQKLITCQKQNQQIQQRLTQSALKHQNEILSISKQNSSVSNFYSPSHFSSPVPSSHSSSLHHLQQIQQLKRILHQRNIQNQDIFRLKKQADYKVFLERQQCNKSLGQKMKQISQLKQRILQLQMQALEFETIKSKYNNLLKGKNY